MGCTASKKRTTSVDDLTDKEPGKKKNGQITANDSKPLSAEKAGKLGSEAPSSTQAIQIPGAQKAFLAPDGIPFIDEDVDENELEVGNATKVVAKPDVNKNVVKVDTTSNAVQVTPPTIVVAGESAKSAEDAKEREVAMDILRQELAVTSAKSAPEPTTTVKVEEVVVTTSTTTESSQPPAGHHAASEEQEKAAVKIQAGIRGYRDRQKVKALRASKHQAGGGEPGHAAHEHSPEDDAAVKIQAGYRGFKARQEVKTMKEHEQHPDSVECNEHASSELSGSGEPHDPDVDRAATKIQATFKGYKTRKEMHKTDND